MCKQHHRNAFNPFLNGLKNGLKNATCKQSLTSPPPPGPRDQTQPGPRTPPPLAEGGTTQGDMIGTSPTGRFSEDPLTAGLCLRIQESQCAILACNAHYSMEVKFNHSGSKNYIKNTFNLLLSALNLILIIKQYIPLLQKGLNPAVYIINYIGSRPTS